MERITEQKQIIMEAFKKGYHPTADELLAKIKKSHPDFSRATLYRNLANFVKKGDIVKVCVKNSADRYELACGDHYHLVCETCGKIENINLTNTLKTPSRLMDYDVNSHEIIFYGICPKCAKKK